MFDKVMNIVQKYKTQLIIGLIIIIAGAIAAIELINAPSYDVVKVTRGEISSDIEASGTVRSKQSIELVWKTNGVVDKVNVKIGDVVTGGQVLAELDMLTVEKSVLIAESDRILAEQEMTKISQPGLALAQAWTSYVTSKHKTEDAQVYYDSLVSKRSGTELLEDINDEITDARLQVKYLQGIFIDYYEQLSDSSTRKLQMIVKITQAKQNVTDLIARYNWFNGHADPDVVEMALSDLNIAKANEADNERIYRKIKENGNIEEIAKVQARIDSATSVLSRAKLTSPINGIVTNVNVLPGDSVKSGTVSIRVDDLTSYQVDLFISEVDVLNVQVGQAVELTSVVADGKTFDGTVIQIDQAGREVDGVIAYKVKIEFTNLADELKPGMSADMTIHLEKIDSALLIPTEAIRFVEGVRIIFLLVNGQAVPTAVRVGAMSGDTAQVVGGNISEGDKVILNPPSVQGLDPEFIQ
jgi:HlyD family secretion protein